MLTKITIYGLVQGIGFRPFIYHLAQQMGIRGTVENQNNGVVIYTDVSSEQKDDLIEKIRDQHPFAASIRKIEVDYPDSQESNFKRFSIVKSTSGSNRVTQVAPDIMICDQCMTDRIVEGHRAGYPFINCTHCGPRFTIVQNLPYDREQTSMKSFKMCPDCSREYQDVDNRRFHAQPIACNHCGPSYYTTYRHQEFYNYSEISALSSRLLTEGKIIAVKGTGGYHLVCNATDNEAVSRLRKIKMRDRKSFAIMFKDIEYLKLFASVNEEEQKSLVSWRRPIVVLKQTKPLAPDINPGMNTIGCMLPYMPVHYDWFEQINSPALVVTSGNISDEPIAISPEEAEKQFRDQVDLLLHHNRDIHNRVDDSVVQVCGTQTCIIRRSRGYAPEPFFADTSTEGILAFGAEKNSTFALGKEDTIISSQYIGDLKNRETFLFYEESLNRFCGLFRFTPTQLVCDLHPDYLSSQFASEIAREKQLPLLKIQHHHAHAAACMLEYGIDHPVIAVVWDGTGLGDDGNAWGGEFFLCDRSQYTRLTHLDYVPMPGGDKASSEPWRMAIAYMHRYNLAIPQNFERRIGKEKTDLIIRMIEKKVNSPFTSSAGRLFDAFASLTGICDVSGYQAEAPLRLEHICDEECQETYHRTTDADNQSISLAYLFEGVLKDLKNNTPVSRISSKFHHSLARMIRDEAKKWTNLCGVDEVLISGGCFQNKKLTELLQKLFETEDIRLYIPSCIPCNDSGIAAGQMAVAAALKNK